MMSENTKARIRGRTPKEKELIRRLARWGTSQRRDLLRYLGDPPLLSNVPDTYWQTHDAELRGLLSGQMQAAYIDQAEYFLLTQPIGIDWALANLAAANWARGYTFELVGQMSGVRRRALQIAVDNYYRLGQNRGQLVSTISRFYDQRSAERIAVTEISRAAVRGEWEVVRQINQTGARLIPHWATNNDELVCPICGPLNGRPADRYVGDQEPVWVHPQLGGEYGLDPAHPNCRCWRNWTFDG